MDALTLRLTDTRGRVRAVRLPVGNEDAVFDGTLGLLRFEANLHVIPELQRVRLELTVHNPRRARHRGGLWDLGDPGSVLVRELSLEVSLADTGSTGNDRNHVEWIEAPGDDVQQTDGRLEIYQESSGGENWQSRNHVNRDHCVPMTMRGYRVRTKTGERTGLRATPVVAVLSGERYVSCTLEEFWQQFPSAIEAAEGCIRVSFWPGQFPDLHELQAGERNTRVVWLQFGDVIGRTGKRWRMSMMLLGLTLIENC